MIVRILGEGQYSVPDGQRGALEKLDSVIVEAVDANDGKAFVSALAALTAAVREAGEPLADDAFAPSDLVVPFPDSTLEETKDLLAEADEVSGTDNR
ncbi:MAG TPA: hypothetical protein VMV06_03625 [Acidimicrobiales bacterium]|nr:hypothetical protein [Acidimicrobiales bacterium]